MGSPFPSSGVQLISSYFSHLSYNTVHHTLISSKHRPSCNGDGLALFELQAEKISRRKGLSLFKQYMMIHFIGSEFPDQVPDQVISSVNRDPAETILYFRVV